MAKQKGRLLLIKIGDGVTPTEGFTVLCGLTAKTLTINNSEVDVTTADCIDPGGALWTEVLDGAKRISVSGNGYIKTEAAEVTLNELANATPPIANFQIIIPGVGTYSSAFFLSSADYGGDKEDGVTYSISLASTGVVTFVPAV